ncbi:MAG: beta-lactamase family protein [Planctomycetes bacterium]|nr:beta-lactamase family protein [Planctomycetota bacterium]
MRFAVPVTAALAACATDPTIASQVDSAALRDYVAAQLSEHGVPGLQVAMVASAGTLNELAAGVRVLGGEQLQLDDRMHLGSCGKAMTSWLAALLVEDGAIRWQTTVGDALPELARTTRAEHREITLEELLSHRSLLPPFTTAAAWSRLGELSAIEPRARRHEFAAKVLAEPGVPFSAADVAAGFRYSNAGYAVAAAMLERATGASWERLMAQRVFDPLGMAAVIGWPAASGRNDEPRGHLATVDPPGLEPHDPNDDYRIDAVLAPAGDISVSIRGYAAFLRQQLRGRRGLDPSRDAAFYRHLHHAIEFGSEYSLGWYWVDQFDDEVSSHTGSADTFYCSCIVLPGHDIAIAVVANAATDGAREAVTHVRNFLLRPYVSGSTR